MHIMKYSTNLVLTIAGYDGYPLHLAQTRSSGVSSDSLSNVRSVVLPVHKEKEFKSQFTSSCEKVLHQISCSETMIRKQLIFELWVSFVTTNTSVVSFPHWCSCCRILSYLSQVEPTHMDDSWCISKCTWKIGRLLWNTPEPERSPFSLLGTFASAGLPRLRLGGDALQLWTREHGRERFDFKLTLHSDTK